MTLQAAPLRPEFPPAEKDGKDLQTVCVLCSHNCGIRVDVADGAITAVRPDPTNAITHGYMCNKAVTVGKVSHHAQRVLTPRKRRADGSFDEISWDQAIAEIAAKLVAIRDDHSPKAIGVVGVGGQGAQLNTHFTLPLLHGLGSKRWFCAWAQEKHQHSLVSHWMFDSSPSNYLHSDLANTRYLMVIGTNPKISNMAHNANETFRDLAKNGGVTVAVVDPRETETAKQADEHARLRPGTDVWLLLGMLGHIVQTPGLPDDDFIARKVVGWDEFRAEMAAVDVEAMAQRCGVPAEQIRRMAEGYARAESASLMHELGAEQVPFSTVVAYLLQGLAVVTGNIGRDGGTVFAGCMKPPVRDPKRFEEPERSIAAGIRAIPSFGWIPMFSPTLVPEDVLVDHPDRLRALIIEGANPWLSYSDTRQWRRAREKLDLVVVIDPAMTESAWEADYVLPAPTAYEKWEWTDFVKSYPSINTQLRKPVLPAQGDALPEAEIHARLMEASGLVPKPSPELEALAENALTPGGAAAFLERARREARGSGAAELVWIYRLVGPQLPAPSLVGIWRMCFFNALTRREAVLLALGEDWHEKDPYEIGSELWRRILAHPEGVEIARLDRATNLEENIGWKDGLIRLLPEGIVSELERAIATESITNDEFPFTLSAGLRTRWTANTIQREPSWRKGKGSACTLHMAPDDIAQLGIEDGKIARVQTRVGAVVLPVEADAKLSRGHAWIPNGYGMWQPGTDPRSGPRDGVNINELTDARDRDPISGCPHHKTTLCRIEAA